jgi:hypothetical protein
MMTCKQISKALADGDYRDLSPMRLFLLRLHVGMCFLCHGFNRDIMLFQDTARAFREHEDDMAPETHLPEDARERMREALRTAKA